MIIKNIVISLKGGLFCKPVIKVECLEPSFKGLNTQTVFYATW